MAARPGPVHRAHDPHTEDVDTAALLADLLRMRGRQCGSVICGHEALMSLVAGYKDSARCLSCLSRLLGCGREGLRDYLHGYIMSRRCRHAGWLWADREKGVGPDALPGCLWLGTQVISSESQQRESVIMLTDGPAPCPSPDAEWDAGDMGCGEFVMELRIRLQSLKPGQVLKLTARDAGVPEDLPAWCRLTGHKLLVSNHPEYWIQRKEN